MDKYFLSHGSPGAFDLLERMLPTEVIRLPTVDDAEAVCGVPVRAG